MPSDVDDSAWQLIARVLLARLPGGAARISEVEIARALEQRIVAVNGELRLYAVDDGPADNGRDDG